MLRLTAALCMVLVGSVVTAGLGEDMRTVSVRELPEPRLESKVSVEKAISKRRSRRSYADRSLDLEQLAQLLWAAQGITGPKGVKRAAPSAGGTYPMSVYVSVRREGVANLDAGVYHYKPHRHALETVRTGDLRSDLVAASGGKYLKTAPAVLIVAGDYSRTTRKYPERGRRYVLLEAGHICQNVYLQAEALGLATVTVGGFNDSAVRRALGMPEEYVPFELMPVGHPK